MNGTTGTINNGSTGTINNGGPAIVNNGGPAIVNNGTTATNLNGTSTAAYYGRMAPNGVNGQIDAANPNGTSGTINPNDINGPAVPGNLQEAGRYGTFNPDATVDQLEPGAMHLASEGSRAVNGYQQGTNPYDVNPYLNPNDLNGTEQPQRYGTFNPDATIDQLEPGSADWMSGGSNTGDTGVPSAIAPNGADESRNPATEAARSGAPAYGSDVSRSATTQAARSGNIPSGSDVSRTAATDAARSNTTSSTSTNSAAQTGGTATGSTGSTGSIAR